MSMMAYDSLGPRMTLTESDYHRLEQSYISREIAESALLFRVSSEEGKARFGQSGVEDFSGIVFRYRWPGEARDRSEQLRRDNPPFTEAHGRRKEHGKYLSAPGLPNLLYFHPNTQPKVTTDTAVPVVFTEGQKKVLALWRLAHKNGVFTDPLFVPIGLNGIWGFRGTIGDPRNAADPGISETGVLSDFDRIAWTGRRVCIVFGTGTHTKKEVAAARHQLARELRARGADVWIVDLPDEPAIQGGMTSSASTVRNAASASLIRRSRSRR